MYSHTVHDSSDARQQSSLALYPKVQCVTNAEATAATQCLQLKVFFILKVHVWPSCPNLIQFFSLPQSLPIHTKIGLQHDSVTGKMRRAHSIGPKASGNTDALLQKSRLLVRRIPKCNNLSSIEAPSCGERCRISSHSSSSTPAALRVLQLQNMYLFCHHEESARRTLFFYSKNPAPKENL